jgi:hypothetical protein
MNPGAPSNYPRGKPNSNSAGEVNLDAISRAWNIVTKNLGPYALACFLAGIPVIAAYILGFALMIPFIQAETPLAYVFGFAIFMVVIIIGMTVASVITAGMVAMTLKALRGETPEISDISEGFVSNPFGLIGAALISSFAVTIGSYLCYIPGFVIGGLWLLTVPMMLDKKLGTIEALKESFKWMQPHWIMAAVLFFLISMVSGLGAIACGVGILVTMPMYFAVTAIVYEDLRTAQNPFEGYQVTPEAPSGYISQAPTAPTDPFVGYAPVPPQMTEEAPKPFVEPPPMAEATPEAATEAAPEPVSEPGPEPEKPSTEPPQT